MGARIRQKNLQGVQNGVPNRGRFWLPAGPYVGSVFGSFSDFGGYGKVSKKDSKKLPPTVTGNGAKLAPNWIAFDMSLAFLGGLLVTWVPNGSQEGPLGTLVHPPGAWGPNGTHKGPQRFQIPLM